MTSPRQDIVLDITGSPVQQQSTPHGMLRSLLQPVSNHTDAQIGIRHDDEHMVFAVVSGKQADTLCKHYLDWQWDHLPKDIINSQIFSDQLFEYLNGPAKSIGNGDDTHTLVVGIISRKFEQGKILLGWVGTSGLRLYNIQRESLPLDVGLFPGEGWSPKFGIFPAEARPHVHDARLNTIDRLIVYAPALLKLVDELPFLGRVALQRVAEAQSDKKNVYLLDFKPTQVMPRPTGIVLNYRWESPTKVNLSWTGSEDATGFNIEESPSPSFIDVSTLAELTDHRQRVYTVIPPSDRDVYYRVVPINKNVRGEPSTPVIVTPVPIVPPLIEEITWNQEGVIRVQWSDVPQADTYELEFSPSQDFDSAQTAIVYRGASTYCEVENEEQPAGWYFRVRSRNNHFMPELPSIWSGVKRAPHRLATPTFMTVSPDIVSWTPIDGADSYQVRRQTATLDEIIALVHEPKFTPNDELTAVYEIRAIRREGDENTASNWSSAITLGGYILDDEDTESNLRVGSDTLPVRPQTRIKPQAKAQANTPMRQAMWLIGIAALMLLVGLAIGLLTAPQLGVGANPTDTPLADVDVQATLAQNMLNEENAIARATLSSDLNRVNIAATENTNQLNNLQTRNANLRGVNGELTDTQASLEAEIGILNTEATAYSESLSTLEAEQVSVVNAQSGTIDAQNMLATGQANEQSTLQADVLSLEETVEALENPSPTPTLTPSPTVPPVFGKQMSTRQKWSFKTLIW